MIKAILVIIGLTLLILYPRAKSIKEKVPTMSWIVAFYWALKL